jgi:tetratricopeptide (TPR) repeat protein
MHSKAWFAAGVLITLSTLLWVSPPLAAQDTLDGDVSWSELTASGRGLVFGRFEGQFDGPLFRSRKLRLRKVEDDKEYFLPIEDNLGYFHVVVEPGTYALTGMEANYVALTRPLNLRNYRPVRQRFGVRTAPEAAPPRFRVDTERPVYLGTIHADSEHEGIVYRGHALRVFDDLDAALERLDRFYPRLAGGLAAAGIAPVRQFVVKPTPADDGLGLVDTEDPIRRARAYLGEGKYQSAVNWLTTFMPASEAERAEARLLVGEALLGDMKHDDAIERLGDVLQEDPNNLRALRLLARAHAAAGHHDDALGLFEALSRQAPQDTEARLQLGYLYALRNEPDRARQEFAAAFAGDLDYLLHDVRPFAVMLKAIKESPGAYAPPVLIKADRPPSNLPRSRRAAEEGGMSLIIDHTGKVAAARVPPDTEGPEPVMLMSIVRAIFRPAALNGIPVPAVLLFGGQGPPQSQ